MLERNLLLRHFPSAALDDFRAAAVIDEVRIEQELSTSGDLDVFFPLDCIISLLRTFADGSTIEIGMVGAEGVAGLTSALNIPHDPHVKLIQGRGRLARIPGAELGRIMQQYAEVQPLVLRYLQALFFQSTQLAACNRIHAAQQRLAHWLLLIHDRAATDEISVTQEFLGLMMGSRRATINEAMAALVRSGAIEHRRARVLILDRVKLQSLSCSCYAASVEDYTGALGFAPLADGRDLPID